MPSHPRTRRKVVHVLVGGDAFFRAVVESLCANYI